MTNEQILKGAIEKAGKNGWKPSGYLLTLEKGIEELSGNTLVIEDYLYIIFSHDFAKAVWGEVMTPLYFGEEPLYWKGWGNNHQYVPHLPAWQYHLQQMVLKKDPLKYIEKYL